MPVNFFEAACQTSTNAVSFGLCDDTPPPIGIPAYIDVLNRSNWIAIVSNQNEETVTFTAIDNCIEIRRPDGSLDSRCDGMLTWLNQIVFVELKARKGKGWLGIAERQLRATIQNFANNHDLSIFSDKTAYVTNSLIPQMRSPESVRKQKFKDDTGFNLEIQQKITI